MTDDLVLEKAGKEFEGRLVFIAPHRSGRRFTFTIEEVQWNDRRQSNTRLSKKTVRPEEFSEEWRRLTNEGWKVKLEQ